MALLNYTTKIDAHKSISEISQSLSKVGVSAIMHDYDTSGNIIALSFRIKLGEQDISFRLPTDWHPVLAVLERQRVPRSLQTQAQALRVSWRITKDWVEAQVAFIETMMVTTAQVFLPYAITKDGQSVYEHIANNTGILMLAPNTKE